MKKVLLLSVVAMCTAVSLSAQISKGSTYLGGSLSYSQTDSDIENQSYGQTNLSVNPAVGFAYKENRMWGVSLNYYYTKSKGSGNKMSSYGVGGFLRQYKPLGKGFYLFAHEGLSGYYSRSEYYSATTPELKGFGVSAGVSPGFAFDLSKKFQLELILNSLLYASYGYSSGDSYAASAPVKTSSSSFNIGTNLSQLSNIGNLGIGARYVFGR